MSEKVFLGKHPIDFFFYSSFPFIFPALFPPTNVYIFHLVVSFSCSVVHLFVHFLSCFFRFVSHRFNSLLLLIFFEWYRIAVSKTDNHKMKMLQLFSVCLVAIIMPVCLLFGQFTDRQLQLNGFIFHNFPLNDEN